MPSLLVTKKMSPELAARVQASVEGRRAPPGARLAPRAISMLRLTASTLILVTLTWLGLSVYRSRQALANQRADLLERVRQESASLAPDEHEGASRLLPWLALHAGSYAGDLVSDELRRPGAFASVLARPTVYVRGPLAGVADRVGESAASSFKDAFVLCLNAPPSARTEALLRAKARAAYSTKSQEMLATLHVQRLNDALIGLPFLGPEWTKRVETASSRVEVERLRREFERAPLERAKQSARATLFLFVMDEPNPEPGPTELDGERPHDVRVGLVDMRTRKVLLRLRRRVDPSWLSAATRAEYASGIDSCALALDVHAAVDPGRQAAAAN